MSETKHTPTPWELHPTRNGHAYSINPHEHVAWFDDPGDAIFAITACNEHDDLVVQRDNLVEIVEMILEAHNGKAPLEGMAVALLTAPAAIAQAKQPK